jgi:hypothetical protein
LIAEICLINHGYWGMVIEKSEFAVKIGMGVLQKETERCGSLN